MIKYTFIFGATLLSILESRSHQMLSFVTLVNTYPFSITNANFLGKKKLSNTKPIFFFFFFLIDIEEKLLSQTNSRIPPKTLW